MRIFRNWLRSVICDAVIDALDITGCSEAVMDTITGKRQYVSNTPRSESIVSSTVYERPSDIRSSNPPESSDLA